MRLAIPDLISNSYFTALAAAELGHFARHGLDVTAELIFPVDRAYEALRDGDVDFVAGAAHGALAAFPEWRGVKLLGALAQGMYWFLVMRKDLGIARGDLAALKGRRIGAAPWVEMGLRRLLATAGSIRRAMGSQSPQYPARPAPQPISASPRHKPWKTARSTGSGQTAWRLRSR
jgi:NitT/TauT family transport system substrate-binding protein